MPVLDPRAHLRAVTERNQRLLVNDLKAIPRTNKTSVPAGPPGPRFTSWPSAPPSTAWWPDG
jgi:hypothetical protein